MIQTLTLENPDIFAISQQQTPLMEAIKNKMMCWIHSMRSPPLVGCICSWQLTSFDPDENTVSLLQNLHPNDAVNMQTKNLIDYSSTYSTVD